MKFYITTELNKVVCIIALMPDCRIVRIPHKPYETLADAQSRLGLTVEDSREHSEREKIASVRASEKPVKGDDAESEHQSDFVDTSGLCPSERGGE